METKKYARIKKASVDGVWYADKIGQIFEVVHENSITLLTKSGGHHSVLKEDAEIIVTEKRPAKVGERVLLTAPTNTKGKHRVGDVFTVKEFGETGVHVTEDEFMTLWHKEYEVIVNSEVKNEEADGMEIDLNAMGYDELMAHGDAVMEAIKKRMFQEGFRSAKQAQRKLAKMNTEKSAQARRDEIVEQSKADVEKLSNYGDGVRYVTGTGSVATCKVEFVVNSDKRAVVALLKGLRTGKVYAKGIAKAAPDDCFNVHIGKAIALRRALGLAVPDEYLNAPQPTEVRVGDVVSNSTRDVVGGVLPDDSWRPLTGSWVRQSDARKYGALIIDDSREEVGE